MSIERATFFNILDERLSLEELRLICFQLNIDYENMSSVKNILVRDLVLYAEKHNRIKALCSIIRRLRPDIELDFEFGNYNSNSTTNVNNIVSHYKEKYQTQAWINILNKVYQWVIDDQIKETGCWGKSHVPIIEEASGESMSKLEKQEGGIYSTFIAIRGLLACQDGDIHQFRMNHFCKDAKKYLLLRQTNLGGFGRFIHSRSGIEIHPSLRHTAYAISALLDLLAPPEVINRGIKFISNFPIEALKDDAAPSEAIGAILHLKSRFQNSPDYYSMLNSDSSHFVDSEDKKNDLLMELANQSESSNIRPFWKPYGGYEMMVYDTALTTIDLVLEDCPSYIEQTIVDILLEIYSKNIHGGIPKNPQMNFPDIGITAYFLSILSRPSFLNILSVSMVGQFETMADETIRFLEENFDNRDYWKYTYCDTLPNILNLKKLLR